MVVSNHMVSNQKMTHFLQISMNIGIFSDCTFRLTLMLLLANCKMMQKAEKQLKQLAYGYSCKNTQGELSNEYQDDGV